MSDQLLSTYHMFPNDERQMGDTMFYEKESMNIFDYLNLVSLLFEGRFNHPTKQMAYLPKCELKESNLHQATRHSLSTDVDLHALRKEGLLLC